jgi:transposase
MIKMTQIEKIKELKDKKGLSFREISNITGIDRRIISKWYSSKTMPKYERKKNNTAVKDKIAPYIKLWVKEDLELIKQRKKRRIRNASTMWGDLNRLGIKCGESTVRQYFKELKPNEVFIPLEYNPGEEMQIDWGHINIRFINDITIRVNIFVATLPYSNARFVYPYIKADQMSFFDGHIKSFNFFKGIPSEIITYDNLSSAVKKVLSGISREEQDKMIYFKNFYGFETNYCAPGKGNEKGSVENGVGFAKRRFLSGSYIFKDFDELREYLAARCEEELEHLHYKKRVKIKKLLEEEQDYFKGFPDFDFDCNKIIQAKSRSNLLVEYDGVKYSIPDNYCEKNIHLNVTPEEIIIYDSKYCDKKIAFYKRKHNAG